ncbi:methyltransferase domain-containing protein [Parasedimentitalea maritima]|uniref:Chemotaxis protein methyltransferase n=1 Tax=Parasedimentitalea maritima TaxID=2578117 RepID=A0A5R8ZCJ1_9RHOB|nr:protein-glutamate O-methyltransferase [Zongyanglinia marina]KAE9629200.1 methyltransferase domain-containing protein [Zongyanglinia marina]TLP62586.1 methyltransferase domain-containing protein [Zongyanglinia marina]
MTIAHSIEPSAGQFILSDQDFEAVAKFAHKNFGLALSSSKKPLVSSRLSRRLNRLNVRDFKSYLSNLDTPGGEGERSELLSLLTTNVTQFFREPHHFETLREDVLPPLIEKARSGGRVRLWSAGCSNGQEPYTMAMVLNQLCPDAARLDIKILGTDIDPVVVRTAQAAQYPADELAQIPAKYRAKGAGDQLPDEILSLVSFGVLNLIEPFPFKGKFDAIFCRNVAIYFDTPTQQHVWSAFQKSLNPGGYLFIGHSERMSGPAATHLQTSGITTYINSSAGLST